MFHLDLQILLILWLNCILVPNPPYVPQSPSPWPPLFYSLFLCVCFFFFFFLSLQNRWHSIYLSLEKEMTIHSSLLAWEISWRKKPGELQSMILQKVGLNLGSKPPPPSFIFYIWLMVSKLVHSAYIHLPFFLSNYLIFQITHFFIIKTPPLDIQTT